MNKAIRLPRTQKRVDFLEKSNDKYKAAADKKKREKLFEEADMIKVYLKRERISYERVTTEQLYSD